MLLTLFSALSGPMEIFWTSSSPHSDEDNFSIYTVSQRRDNGPKACGTSCSALKNFSLVDVSVFLFSIKRSLM